MEFRLVEYHYSLVEVELMNEKEIEDWIKYARESKDFFPFEKLLGTASQLMNVLKTVGNSKVTYHPAFHQIRDLWESKEDKKVYDIGVELK